MSGIRRQADWEDGTDQLHVAEQYAGVPEHGLAVKVAHRTTGDGRAILLKPAQATELHAFLGDYLASLPSACPATAIKPGDRTNNVRILENGERP